MGADKESLIDNMHQIVYEVLKTSLEEADAGFCTEINITLYEDGRVKITDNEEEFLFHQMKRQISRYWIKYFQVILYRV